jgi:hypothetical protein
LRLRVVVFIVPCDVPVMVTVADPVVAFAVAVKVRVLEVVAGFGLKEVAVTPVGRLEAERVTLPLKPFSGVMVMTLVALLLCARVMDVAESVKFWACCGLPDPPPQPIRELMRQTATTGSSPSFRRNIALFLSLLFLLQECSLL